MAAQVWTSWPGGIGWPTPVPIGGKRKASKKTRKAKKTRKSGKSGRKTRYNRK